jgi:hypothetical protein
MTDATPIWKIAVRDEKHPLNRAVWMLFSETFNLKYAAAQLLPQQAEVLQLIDLILDTPELEMETSFGAGMAPINAVELLTEWKIKGKVALLLPILAELEADDVFWGAISRHITGLGKDSVEPLLAFAEATDDDEMRSVCASFLGDCGIGDPRAFAFILNILDDSLKERNMLDAAFQAENLLTADTAAAIPELEARLKQLDTATRKRIQKYIADAKAGKWLEPDMDDFE